MKSDAGRSIAWVVAFLALGAGVVHAHRAGDVYPNSMRWNGGTVDKDITLSSASVILDAGESIAFEGSLSDSRIVSDVNNWIDIRPNNVTAARFKNTEVEFTMPVQHDTSILADMSNTGDAIVYYCSDCTKGSDPCTGSGSGTFAFRINGAWTCL